MDIRQLQALTALVPAVVVQTEVGGQMFEQHPVGVRDYVRYVVRPHRSMREQIVAPTRAAGAFRPEATDEEAEAAIMAKLDLAGQVEAIIDDRDEADSAFVALTLCRPRTPRDLAPWVEVVRQLPDAAFDALYAGAEQVTYGDDRPGFFGRVQEKLTGVNLVAPTTPPTPAANA